MPLLRILREVRLIYFALASHSPEISEASLQTTILISRGKDREREREKKEETREKKGKGGRAGLFLCRRMSSESRGASSVLRNSRSEYHEYLRAKLVESEGNVKGGPLLPTLLPLPRAPASETGIRSVYMYLPPPAGCKPTIAGVFCYYYYYSLFFFSAASSVPRTAPGTQNGPLGEYLLNARMISQFSLLTLISMPPHPSFCFCQYRGHRVELVSGKRQWGSGADCCPL